MTCTQCKEKEVTSKLTGELCTSCYFANKSLEQRANLPVDSNQSKDESNEIRGSESLSKPISIVSGISETVQTDDSNYIEEIGEGNYRCDDCGETHEEPSNGKERKCTQVHSPSINIQQRDADKKYCQSCLERGYGLRLAEREWTEGYWICQDCFEPLLNNIVTPNDEDLRNFKKEIPVLDSEKPVLNQIYDILNIPENIRYQDTDKLLNSRNDIFQFHANAIINKDANQIASEIEQMQIILFQIKIALEPRQDYINRAKHEERTKAGIEKIEKSKKEFGKGDPTKSSKVKQSQDQKMADMLYKTTIASPAERLKKYLEIQKNAREQEFKKRTGT